MLKDSEIGNIAAIGPAGHPPCSNLAAMRARMTADDSEGTGRALWENRPFLVTSKRNTLTAADEVRSLRSLPRVMIAVTIAAP